MQHSRYEQSMWYDLLDENGKRLVSLSSDLLEREIRMQTALESFSFVVFPMAKAYEGFIKLYLKRMGFLNRPDYIDTKFRIGRALNPDISDQQKNEWWLYDDMVRSCGEKTAREMWDAWIQCRNHVFHYYFGQETKMTLLQAEKKLQQLASAMDHAMECQINQGGSSPSLT